MSRGLPKTVSGSDGSPERLNIPAVAARCGVTPRTAYTWVRTGVLPATKIGPKLWWVLASDLDIFLAGGGAASASSSPGPSEPAVSAPKREKVSKPPRASEPVSKPLDSPAGSSPASSVPYPAPPVTLPGSAPLKPMQTSTRAQRRAKKAGR